MINEVFIEYLMCIDMDRCCRSRTFGDLFFQKQKHPPNRCTSKHYFPFHLRCRTKRRRGCACVKATPASMEPDKLMVVLGWTNRPTKHSLHRLIWWPICFPFFCIRKTVHQGYHFFLKFSLIKKIQNPEELHTH